MYKADKNDSIAELKPALEHLERTVQLNPDLAESEYAKKEYRRDSKAMQTR